MRIPLTVNGGGKVAGEKRGEVLKAGGSPTVQMECLGTGRTSVKARVRLLVKKKIAEGESKQL